MNRNVRVLIERIRLDLSDIILSMPKANVLTIRDASVLRDKIERYYGHLKGLFFNTFPSDYHFPELAKRSFAVKLGEFKSGVIFVEYLKGGLVVETRVDDDVSICPLGRAVFEKREGLKVVIEDFAHGEVRGASCKTIIDVVMGILYFRRDGKVLLSSQQAHTLPVGATQTPWAEYEIWVQPPFKDCKLINRTFEI